MVTLVETIVGAASIIFVIATLDLIINFPKVFGSLTRSYLMIFSTLRRR